MIYVINEFFDKFRSVVGDTTVDCPDDFLINATNWCFNELPNIPKLNKLFSARYVANLRTGSYRWKINRDFRSINDILYMYFYTSKGGKPCRAKVCNLPNDEFYAKAGIVELNEPGIPCSYTIEFEGDDAYLVFDRPLSVPMMLQYTVTGYPKPITSVNEKREISAVGENLIIALMRKIWYEESDDFAFSGAIEQYLDNKLIQEAVFQLNKKFQNEMPRVLGGA